MTLSLQEIKKALIGNKDYDTIINALEPLFKENKGSILLRQNEFRLKVEATGNKYPSSLKQEFCDYWTEHGIKDRKMRFEKQKSFDINLRLKQWQRRSKPCRNNLTQGVNHLWQSSV